MGTAHQLLHLAKHSSEKNLTLCFLAFRFPREIVVYSLEADVAPTSIGHLPIDDPLSQEHPDNPEALEVHSIHLLVVSKITFLLLGMRYGHLLSARFEYDATVGTSFTDQQSTRVGHKQVAFMSSSQEKVEAPFVFLSSDSLWEVSFKDGKLQINEILFDYYRTVSLKYAPANVAQHLIRKLVHERSRACFVDGWNDPFCRCQHAGWRMAKDYLHWTGSSLKGSY